MTTDRAPPRALVLDPDSQDWLNVPETRVLAGLSAFSVELGRLPCLRVYVNFEVFAGGELLQTLSEWLDYDGARTVVLFQVKDQLDRRLVARAVSEFSPSTRARMAVVTRGEAHLLARRYATERQEQEPRRAE